MPNVEGDMKIYVIEECKRNGKPYKQPRLVCHEFFLSREGARWERDFWANDDLFPVRARVCALDLGAMVEVDI